jgi:hypothetical protein
MAEEKKGTGEPGWKPEEKSPDASGRAGSAKAAGEAAPKGRPNDAREQTESAAARTEQDSKRQGG